MLVIDLHRYGKISDLFTVVTREQFRAPALVTFEAETRS
jgi:hypothetical protein